MWSYDEFISDTRFSGETSLGDSAEGEEHHGNTGNGPAVPIEETSPRAEGRVGGLPSQLPE